MEHQQDDEPLAIRQQGAVRIFTLNRPDRANAMDTGLRDDLAEALLQADDDPDVAAMVITGAGGRSFCAGADIKAVADADCAGHRGPAPGATVRRNLPELITELRKPVVAAINGTAVGGGFELALACDLRVAEEHARFALPEAKRGMGAHFASVVLPRLVPEAIAFEMLFTGEFVTAQDAWRWGLLNRLVPTGQAMTTALQLASVVSCKFVE